MSASAGLEVRGPRPAGARPTEDHTISKPSYNAGLTGPIMSGTRTQLRRLLAQIDLDEALRRRSVQQAISEATAEYWRGRAQDFERVGNARRDQVALACRRKAAFLEWEAGQPLIDPGEAA
jgi:spore germination protein YaaH